MSSLFPPTPSTVVSEISSSSYDTLSLHQQRLGMGSYQSQRIFPCSDGASEYAESDCQPLIAASSFAEEKAAPSSSTPPLPSLVSSNTSSVPPVIPGYLSRRRVMCWFMFFSTVSMYMVRVNISDCILDMSKEYGWSSTQKGLVLSSFFFGYVALQIPGGLLAVKYGGKRVLLFAVAWAGVCTLLTPIAASFNIGILVAVRVLMGLGEGVSYPSLVALLSLWLPMKERSVYCSLVWGGAPVGTIFSLFVTPFLMSGLGWPSSFYFYGGGALVWSALWYWFATDSPAAHPSIHPQELKYIQNNLSAAQTDPIKSVPTSTSTEYCPTPAISIPAGRSIINADGYSALSPSSVGSSSVTVVSTTPTAPSITPNEDPHSPLLTSAASSLQHNTDTTDNGPQVWLIWKTLLQRKAVWAVVVQNFTVNWHLYILISWLPQYFQDQWDIDIQSDALAAAYMSAMPFGVWLIFSNFAGFIADYLIAVRHFARLRVRMAFQCIALSFSALFLILLAFKAQSVAEAQTYLSLSVGTIALHTSGYVPCVLDMGGSFASYIMALSNTAGTLPGILGVFITGFILDRTNNNWTLVFSISASINIIGLIVWIFCGSAAPIHVASGKDRRGDADQPAKTAPVIAQLSHADAKI